MVGQLDDLDEPSLLERPADDEPRVDELLAVDGCSPRSGGGGARRSPLRRRARGRACPRSPRPPARRAASCRRDPRRPSARAAGRSRRCGVSGSISVEFAPSSPTTCRANSETATCMPRQMPRYGILRSRATLAGEDLSLPAARAEAAGNEHAVDRVEQLGRLLVRHVLGVDPAHADRAAVVQPGVLERLVHGEVGVLELHVLADERDLDELAALRRCASSARPTRRGRRRPRSMPSFSQTSRSRPSSCSTSGTR